MYKVLIADDEAIIREGIKCLYDWESLGFSVVDEAATGEQAYTGILQHNPDVVLMDIRMPGKSGLDVIRELRTQGFIGKIIVISGYSDFRYAQEAIRYGVEDYITKPVDEDELEQILRKIKSELDQNQINTDTEALYRKKAYHEIIQDILVGTADTSLLDLNDLHLNTNIYQVVIYEKYSHNAQDVSYSFSDMIRVTNQDNHTYDSVVINNNETLLLKGSFAISQFNDFLKKYEQELTPQKGSPLDSLFITYGRCVSNLEDIPKSYHDALTLLKRRFYCDHRQHTIGYDALPALQGNKQIIDDSYLKRYTTQLLGFVQTSNRSQVAETLSHLEKELYDASDSIDDIKLFLADLFLQIKDQMSRIYTNISIPSLSNTHVIKFINERYYLYEIILFFTEQFEIMMSATGNSNRDSVLNDVLYYIDHNYANNITLENIAPLFGYNSSYLGKIFSKKMGENFNSYIDHVRIEHSKKLLLQDDMKVYMVAEKVGYRNVDYFHIKFKKYTGQSPAEYRKKGGS